MRVSTFLTMLASMSSVNESNFWPFALRKSSAALVRFQSLVGSLKPGRYQATTLMPCACAASTSLPASARRKIVEESVGRW